MTIQNPTRPEVPVTPEQTYGVQGRIDRWLALGAGLTGTLVLGPLGAAVFAWTYRLTRQARTAGHVLRNDVITVVGVTMMVDAAINFLGWSLDLMPTHDSDLVVTLYTGIGRIWDGGYYLGYNSTHMGGTAFAGEKALEFGACLLLYSMRMVAAWGLLKMKRWGYEFMLINMWMSVFFWFVYLMNLTQGFEYRFGYDMFGLTSWWVLNIWYAAPLVVLPYLYTVDRRRWCH